MLAPGGIVSDDRLGRALEAFAPVAETVRGRDAGRDRHLRRDAARLHLDLTTAGTGGYPGSDLVAKGWGPPSRQVNARPVAARHRGPDVHRPHPGGADGRRASPTCSSASRAGPARPGLVVADSALGHLKNLCEADPPDCGSSSRCAPPPAASDRFPADVPDGLAALAVLDHCSRRTTPATEPAHQVARRAARHVITDPHTGATTSCASPTSGPPRSRLRRRRPRTRPDQGRRPLAASQRTRRAALQDPKTGRSPGRQDRRPHRIAT